MHYPIASLGKFLFSPSSGSFEQLSRETTSPRATLEVIGRRNLKQWMGPADDVITIAGSVWPEIQLPGMSKLEDIAAIAGTGLPMPLMDGRGSIRGIFGIEAMRRTEGEIEPYGYPGEITFEIEMVEL